MCRQRLGLTVFYVARAARLQIGVHVSSTARVLIEDGYCLSGYGCWLPPYGTAYCRALRTTRTRFRTRSKVGATRHESGNKATPCRPWFHQRATDVDGASVAVAQCSLVTALEGRLA